ncbi:small RNA degrading nuclease 5 isoform X2 [Teleopsis dalmanni]|uniref:small RNA degrading nuclease 5 isoform X2 n=1 Tax=Teleopsis dalmanni TaxID=139649 RepID=UPI0018CC8012|nr:small RNA degrading nuclease 5 isoform X2 [Teleopsis dalmanni]
MNQYNWQNFKMSDSKIKMKTSKQLERSEKKKRKLAALAILVELNDHDRMKEASLVKLKRRGDTVVEDVNSPAELEKNEDDGFQKVTYKRNLPRNKLPVQTNSDEPSGKRAKLENEKKEDTSDETSTNSDNRIQLTNEQCKEIKEHLRERHRQLESYPTLRLREYGQRAMLDVPREQRIPIFLTDVQHLLMSAVTGNKSPCTPERWCTINKPVRLTHSVVLILEGFSLYHYLSNESKFEETKKIFDTRLELVLPPCKDGMIVEDLTKVPLTTMQAQVLIQKHGSLESAVRMNTDPTLLVNSIFPIDQKTEKVSKLGLPQTDKFPRTKLLLSALQMVDEGYPMPLRGELSERFKDYVFTKEKYEPVTDHSPMYAVDCEMCRTTTGRNELTRISIVNEAAETVYETLVLPTNKITDYLTHYSGITPELMRTVTKSLKEVQKEVSNLLPSDAILIGQSLNSDLNAMRMMHPYVIDTSVCFNLTGERRRKSKLATLAITFLKESIQKYGDGHDSVEDSLASLKLVKLKLANSLEFGDEILIQRKRYCEILRVANSENIKNNMLAHATQSDKRTAIVTVGTLNDDIKHSIKKAEEATEPNVNTAISIYELDSNKSAINIARQIAIDNALTITNSRIKEEHLLPDIVPRTAEKIDKWICKLWKSVAQNGMFVVLMGGSAECPSGVAKVAIKNITSNESHDLVDVQ